MIADMNINMNMAMIMIMNMNMNTWGRKKKGFSESGFFGG
jgi:hypothetical protein